MNPPNSYAERQATRAATKLQTAGWLARKTDDLDRRSVVLSLTKAGAKFASVFE
jgi:DNA-binding MarR family transcriptional regulator